MDSSLLVPLDEFISAENDTALLSTEYSQLVPTGMWVTVVASVISQRLAYREFARHTYKK